ncbi:MAG TPA: CPBP family glutamic-type intramembrane protease [Acidimicrobiales bacterium]|nr:CPBP family glutamic-type intramembrane protease [Acidimicrobiales bacterium]
MAQGPGASSWYHSSWPPAAWYPDPSGVAEWRYWDGRAWTSEAAVGGQVIARPMPPPPPPAAAPAAPSRPEPQPRLPTRAAGIAILGFAVGLAASILLNLGGRAVGLPRIGRLLVGQAGLWTGLLGACWIVSRRYGTGRLVPDFNLRIDWADFGWGFLMSLAARVAVVAVVVPIVAISQKLGGGNDEVFRQFRPEVSSFVVVAILAVVGAPIVEELFFRGVLQGAFLDRLGTAGAICVQAVLFGLAHFNPLLGWDNVSVIAGIGAGGVVFGLTVRLRRLGSSIFAHAFFNLLSVFAAAALAMA